MTKDTYIVQPTSRTPRISLTQGNDAVFQEDISRKRKVGHKVPIHIPQLPIIQGETPHPTKANNEVKTVSNTSVSSLNSINKITINMQQMDANDALDNKEFIINTCIRTSYKLTSDGLDLTSQYNETLKNDRPPIVITNKKITMKVNTTGSSNETDTIRQPAPLLLSTRKMANNDVPSPSLYARHKVVANTLQLNLPPIPVCEANTEHDTSTPESASTLTVGHEQHFITAADASKISNHTYTPVNSNITRRQIIEHSLHSQRDSAPPMQDHTSHIDLNTNTWTSQGVSSIVPPQNNNKSNPSPDTLNNINKLHHTRVDDYDKSNDSHPLTPKDEYNNTNDATITSGNRNISFTNKCVYSSHPLQSNIRKNNAVQNHDQHPVQRLHYEDKHSTRAMGTAPITTISSKKTIMHCTHHHIHKILDNYKDSQTNHRHSTIILPMEITKEQYIMT